MRSRRLEVRFLSGTPSMGKENPVSSLFRILPTEGGFAGFEQVEPSLDGDDILYGGQKVTRVFPTFEKAQEELRKWWDAREVKSAGFENQAGRKSYGGSNPSPTANSAPVV